MAKNKIERIDQEIAKTREKIAEQQEKLKDLEAQKTEAENLEIVQMVRALHMTPAQLSAMLSGNFIYKGKSKTVSLLFMGTVALVKFVKDMFHGVFTDLGAFVFYGKTNLFSFRHHPDIDRTTTGTEFDSIGKQIVPYMTDEIFVSKILHIHHVHIKFNFFF